MENLAYLYNISVFAEIRLHASTCCNKYPYSCAQTSATHVFKNVKFYKCEETMQCKVFTNSDRSTEHQGKQHLNLAKVSRFGGVSAHYKIIIVMQL